MTRLSERLGCTQGQVYTLATGVILAVALTLSSTGVITRADPSDAATQEPAASTTTVSPAGPSSFGDFPLAPSLTVGGNHDEPAGENPTGAPPAPQPAAVSCPVRPLLDAVGPVLDTLETSTGLVPAASTQKLIAVITGCSTDDPAATLLAFLAAVANAVPEPPFEIPGLPSLGQIPAPILLLVQPLRPLLDPTCASVGTVAALLTLSLSSFPPWIVAAAINSLLPVLDVCGQIQKP